ncbi:MAG TPA: rhodanese-like domain-containing protein [Arenibaculum sp.]|nr:rhodanese-like domain-containing protein [Arenibaculum sp.]
MRARFLALGLAASILVLALAAAGCSSQETASPAQTNAPAETAGYVTVDVQPAYEALTSDQDAQLLDVREPEEWAETGVPQGAVLIPLAEVESRAAAELAPDRSVYVICRSGNRSRTASEILAQLGYTEVYNVDGGVTAWLDAAQPVESYTP